MKRLPFWPTLVVLLAVLAMVGLGIWQLDRLHEKEALLAHFAANENKPPVALPALLPLKQEDLFRRASAMCLPVHPIKWLQRGARLPGGKPGWRMIVFCGTGAEGPGFAADIGISSSDVPPAWTGGVVRGRVITVPSETPLIARLFSAPAPDMAMIVAENPAPGLARSPDPSPADVPNNHFAYAVQWFLFAGIAVIIYAVALARRKRPVGHPGRRRG